MEALKFPKAIELVALDTIKSFKVFALLGLRQIKKPTDGRFRKHRLYE